MVHVQARRCFAYLCVFGYVATRFSYRSLGADCVAGYFIKYLDQTNINSAFVSGMYVVVLHHPELDC